MFNRMAYNSDNNGPPTPPPPKITFDAAYKAMKKGNYGPLKTLLDYDAQYARSEEDALVPELTSEALETNNIELATILRQTNSFNPIEILTKITSQEMLNLVLEFLEERFRYTIEEHVQELIVNQFIENLGIVLSPPNVDLLNRMITFGGEMFVEKLRSTPGIFTYVAGQPNSVAFLRRLIELGFDAGEIVEDSAGNVSTPLSEAVYLANSTTLRRGDTDVINYLLSLPLTLINVPVTRFQGNSVLQEALLGAFRPDINTILLEYRTRNPSIRSILDIAISNNDIDKVRNFLAQLLTVPVESLNLIQTGEMASIFLERLGTNEDVVFYVTKTAIEKNDPVLLNMCLQNPMAVSLLKSSPSAVLLAIQKMDEESILNLFRAIAPDNYYTFVSVLTTNTVTRPREENVQTTFIANAAEAGKPRVVEYLLRHYNPFLYARLEKYGGKTVVDIAAESGYSPEINALVGRYDVRSAFEPDTPPEDLTQLEVAILQGNREGILDYVGRDGAVPTARDFSFITSKEMILYILGLTSDFRNTCEQALLWAIKHQDPEFFEEINTQLKHTFDSREESREEYIQFMNSHPHILVTAVVAGVLPIVESLLEKDTLDVNTRDEKGNPILAIAAMVDNLELVRYISSFDATLFQLKAPQLGDKSVLEAAKEGKFSEPINDFFSSIKETGKTVLGWYKGSPQESIVGHIYSVFRNTDDISICPVCLFPSDRNGGCMYVKHTCNKTDWYNQVAFNLYSSYDKIEWCTICNRITDGNHTHYVNSILTDEPAPLYNSYITTTTQFFGSDCNKPNIGGGGLQEKLLRFNELLKEAIRIQSTASSREEALNHLSKVFWDAPLVFARGVPEGQKDKAIHDEGNRILAQGHFDVPFDAFPEEPSLKVVETTESAPVFIARKPAENAALVPEVVDEEFMNSILLNNFSRGIRFHHRDGNTEKHHKELFSFNSLVTQLKEDIAHIADMEAGKEYPRYGRCLSFPDCNAFLWPEDLEAIPGLIREDCTTKLFDCLTVEDFQKYKKFFDEKFGQRVRNENAGGAAGGQGAAGGGRRRKRITIKKVRSTRKMRGGVNVSVIPVSSCPLPKRATTRMKAGRRLRKNRKTQKLRKARK